MSAESYAKGDFLRLALETQALRSFPSKDRISTNTMNDSVRSKINPLCMYVGVTTAHSQEIPSI